VAKNPILGTVPNTSRAELSTNKTFDRGILVAQAFLPPTTSDVVDSETPEACLVATCTFRFRLPRKGAQDG
jgi:hypothetical protein